MIFIKNCFGNYMSDIFSTKEIWFYGGYQDVKQKYRRTRFGPFWNTIIVGIFLMGLGPVYSKIFGTNLEDFFPYLAVGFVIWIFFSTTLNENCTIFQDSSGIIKQTNVSIVCYPTRVVIKNFFNFLHIILILPLIFLLSGLQYSTHVPIERIRSFFSESFQVLLFFSPQTII